MREHWLHWGLLILFLCLSAVQAERDCAPSEGYLLRIDSGASWTKHLEIPEGEAASLVVLSPAEGIGYLNVIYPNGESSGKEQYFQRHDKLTFVPETAGRYVLSYAIGDKKSNTVVIDAQSKAALPPIPQTGYILARPDSWPVGTGVRAFRMAAHPEPVSLSQGYFNGSFLIHYDPVGSHIMNDRIGVIIPRGSPGYFFGRDFSLGTIDSNYLGTPFLTQFLADP